MMYLPDFWQLIKQTFVEYLCFLPLDLWAKSALRTASCDEQKRHIWASEAQIIFVECLIAYFCCGVYPVALGLLGYFCFKSSRPPGKKLANGRHNAVKYVASKVQQVWLFFCVMVGDAVSSVYEKLWWNSHGEHVAESLIRNTSSCVSQSFNFLYSVLCACVRWVQQSCVGLWDMLRSNQWDTYQYVSQEQVQGSSPDISSDKLLCHPECELSQRNPCRISASISENHCSQRASEGRQVAGCYPVGSSVWTSAIKPQLYKFVGLLQKIIYSAYYHLSRCRNIKLVPFSFEVSGENLCFVNTVMHCFTKEPSLRKFLFEVVSEQPFLRTNLSEDEICFLQSLHVLLTQSEGNDNSHLKQFVASCSKLVPSLISPPGSEQLQQDVVEFTQWLLNKLHHCCKVEKARNATLFQRSSLHRSSLVYDQHELTAVLWRPNWLDRVKCSLIQPSEVLMKSMQRYAHNEWNLYNNQNMSLICDNFTGQMLDCYQCIMCNQISAQSQTFTILHLALTVKSVELTLQEALRNFLGVEDMEVSEGCACTYSNLNSPVLKLDSLERSILGTTAFTLRSENSAKTSTPVSAGEAGLYDYNAQILSPIGLEFTVPKSQNKDQWNYGVNKVLKKMWIKRTFISRAPKYLIFQLLRFQFDNKSLTKNHQSIRIPLYKLCVPVMDSSAFQDHRSVTIQKEYELCAFIVHLGAKSLSCGHYVAYIRSLDRPTIWNKCDDNVMCEISDIHSEIDSAVVKENVYLLFYRQTSFGG